MIPASTSTSAAASRPRRSSAAAAVTALAAVLVVQALCACKTDDARRKPAVASGARATPPPAAPPSPPARPPERLERARVEQAAPRLTGATPLAPLQVDATEQAHQSWCLAGTDAAAAARTIATALTAAGWTDVSSRGDDVRAGVGATHDELRIAVSVGGRDAACTGVVATATYTGPRLIVPPVEPGERVH